MNNIQQRWSKFLKMEFPDPAHGLAFNLEEFDSSIAGCISSYIASGTLTEDKKTILQDCVTDLSDAMSKIPGESKEYFAELLSISQEVLTKV
jgi:hypothetical protein